MRRQIGRRQRPLLDLVIGGGEPAVLVAADRLAPHLLADARLGYDREVELLLIQQFAGRIGVADVQRRLQRRILPFQPLQQSGQADQREGLAQSQPQHALQRILERSRSDNSLVVLSNWSA